MTIDADSSQLHLQYATSYKERLFNGTQVKVRAGKAVGGPAPWFFHFVLTLVSSALWVFFFIYYFYFWLRWVFVAVRGLFSSCGERGLLFVAVRGLLIAVASLLAEHGL